MGMWVFAVLALCAAAKLPVRLEEVLVQEDGDLLSVKPFIGLNCFSENAPLMSGCGESLVCKHGRCDYCEKNKQCPDKHACLPSVGGQMCEPRDLYWHFSRYDLVCTVLIFTVAILSAAAGLGGGGIFVPLTILLAGLKTSEAVPLSQSMVFAGGIVNVLMFLPERHPKHPERPKIAYDIVMLLWPGLAAGVVLGVLAHLVSPAWITVACLFVTLIFAFTKTFSRGVKLYATESAARAAAPPPQGPNGGDLPAVKNHMKDTLDPERLKAESAKASRQALIIFACWSGFLALNMLHPERCSGGHMAQLAGFLLLAGLFSVIGVRSTNLHGQSLDFSDGKGVKYGLMAVMAGFLGGFLGIGGGMIMGPLLLELGIIPEVGQATTALFVLLSSSLGFAQFVLLDKEMPYYVVWYSTWVIAATVAGQMMSDYVVRVYKRASIIVFAVAAVTILSAVLMVWVGAIDVWDDWSDGAYMGFRPEHICHR